MLDFFALLIALVVVFITAVIKCIVPDGPVDEHHQVNAAGVNTLANSSMSLDDSAHKQGGSEPEELKAQIIIPRGHTAALNEIPRSAHLHGTPGFNMSLIPYEEGYLCAVRSFNTVAGLLGEGVEPGNLTGKYIGKNYIWGAWTTKGTIDTTAVFRCKFDGTDISDVKDLTYISNQVAYLPTLVFCVSDIRLIAPEGLEVPRVFMYDGNISVIKDIVPGAPLLDKYNYINTRVCTAQTGGRDYVKQYDKNWAMLRWGPKNIEFTHWYEEDGVYNVSVPHNAHYACKKYRVVAFKGDKVPPLGSYTLPMFSLGTPYIKISESDGVTRRLSVGHCKIMLSYHYKTGSAISEFRDKITMDVDHHYIEHSSYIYMGYFILYEERARATGHPSVTMYISDAYLPQPTVPEHNGGKKQYKFSIWFPMSCFVQGDELIVSGGYGDYTPIITKFKLEDVLKACRHDVGNFKADDYRYYNL